MNKPYLSIVIVGRNDNYGGDFKTRLECSLWWTHKHLIANKISSEIIFVNYNPLAEPAIEKFINWPKSNECVLIRIITVPHLIHCDLIEKEKTTDVPLLEYSAKNIGIRRAKGEYILCMNPDILIHPEIFQCIGAFKINKHHYYRTNRLDFINAFSFESIHKLYNAGIVVSLKGFVYYFNPFFDKRLQYYIFRLINPLRIAWEFWKHRNSELCNYLGISVTYDNAAYFAHCLNSGDFMLMHKNHWFEFNAYPEYTHIATHTDSIFTIFAYSKLKEYVFSYPVFHQDHERRYTWDTISTQSVHRDAFYKMQYIMQNILSGIDPNNFFNDENWGLKQFNLPEMEIT